MSVVDCDRCDSKIVRNTMSDYPPRLHLTREYEPGEIESEDVILCAMCWDELWKWALGEDTPDRSGYADPIPLDRFSDGVERHIDRLEDMLVELEEAKGHVER